MNNKETKIKEKYWYSKKVFSCILCGKESTYKNRVYSKDQKGLILKEEVCENHFMCLGYYS